MTRHLISRFQQLVVLSVLMLTLATAVLTTTQLSQANIVDAAPAPVQVADGWDDPTGG
ncbi:hypothetical protein [Candidatus Leptofilum sp.]|uniref:hypothetical protein n=1 Tax=Candidatus Leptofilum sp. TaxID=3241576 RepID=UPI003B5B0D90